MNALSFSYNTQKNSTTDHSPFELVLSRPQPPLVLKQEPPIERAAPKSALDVWISRLPKLSKAATEASRKSQERYKRHYDARVRPPTLPLVVGCEATLRRDYKRAGQPHASKLASKGMDPFKIIYLSPSTAVIQLGQQLERVSIDRLEPTAPL